MVTEQPAAQAVEVMRLGAPRRPGIALYFDGKEQKEPGRSEPGFQARWHVTGVLVRIALQTVVALCSFLSAAVTTRFATQHLLLFFTESPASKGMRTLKPKEWTGSERQKLLKLAKQVAPQRLQASLEGMLDR